MTDVPNNAEEARAAMNEWDMMNHHVEDSVLAWLAATWARAYNQGVADDQTAADHNYEHSPARVNPFAPSEGGLL